VGLCLRGRSNLDPAAPRRRPRADAPVGDLAGRPDQSQVYREPELERFELLPPVDGNVDIYPVDGRLDAEVLDQMRRPIAAIHPENCFDRTIFCQPDPLDGEGPTSSSKRTTPCDQVSLGSSRTTGRAAGPPHISICFSLSKRLAISPSRDPVSTGHVRSRPKFRPLGAENLPP
jgi:hypothetical protein